MGVSTHILSRGNLTCLMSWVWTHPCHHRENLMCHVVDVRSPRPFPELELFSYSLYIIHAHTPTLFWDYWKKYGCGYIHSIQEEMFTKPQVYGHPQSTLFKKFQGNIQRRWKQTTLVTTTLGMTFKNTTCRLCWHTCNLGTNSRSGMNWYNPSNHTKFESTSFNSVWKKANTEVDFKWGTMSTVSLEHIKIIKKTVLYS